MAAAPPYSPARPSRGLSDDPARFGLGPVAWPSVAALALAKVAFQLLTARLYGAHRDEFYYLASGHHLAWGYVDQPPLVPVLYRLSEVLFGHSVFALHILPSLIGGLYVLLGALLAREFGGGRVAQTLTGLVAALGPLFLTTSHFLSTVTLDVVAWGVGSLLVLRLVRTGDKRLWLAIGAVVGIGLLNKHTVAFWVLGTLIGLLATPERRLLRTWWLAGGAAITAVLIAPNLLWEIQHHWATLVFLRHLRANNGAHDMIQFLPLQLGMVTVVGTVLWVTGLRATARTRWWRRYRWLAVGYGVCLVVLFALGGKAYYLGSWYLPVVAAGAVAVEQQWSRRATQALTAAIVVTGVLTAPLFTPILPEATLVSWHIDTANSDLGAMLGWPHVVATVSGVFHSLPPSERGRATILTSNYSEAGAVNFWGGRLGLPTAISGHNTYWLWGYGPAGDGPVIAVGLSRAFVDQFWARADQVTTLGNDGVVIDPQERGAPVWILRDQRQPWRVIWPQPRNTTDAGASSRLG